jgi:primosomal protein N''
MITQLKFRFAIATARQQEARFGFSRQLFSRNNLTRNFSMLTRAKKKVARFGATSFIKM